MKRVFALVVSVVLLTLLCVVPLAASTQVTPSAITDVCTTCPVELAWAMGDTPGMNPGGFSLEALNVSWALNGVQYLWLKLNCTEVGGMSNLYIVFETGADVFDVVRTTTSTEVLYLADFESGAYVYGSTGGFYLAEGAVYAEFALTPTVLGCNPLEVYVIQDLSGSEV